MSRIEEFYRRLIKGGGGEFVAVRDGTVVFRDPETGGVHSLYASACRSVEDVRLALKAYREPVADFPPVVPTE